MVGFLQFLAGLGSLIGGIALFFSVTSKLSAPQEAAAAAFSVAIAVIPYVLMRCVQIPRAEERRQLEHRELLAALKEASGGRGFEPTAPPPQGREITGRPIQ